MIYWFLLIPARVPGGLSPCFSLHHDFLVPVVQARVPGLVSLLFFSFFSQETDVFPS